MTHLIATGFSGRRPFNVVTMAAPEGIPGREIRKIAYCSAIVAGFVYVGYTTLKNAFCRSVLRKSNSTKSPEQDEFDERSQAVQTELSLPCTLNFAKISDNLILSSCKSVKDRVKELNLKARLGSEPSLTPMSQNSCKSLQSSPWSSPRILSPCSSNGMSRSAENINCFPPATSPPNSPHINRRKSSLLKSGNLLIEEEHSHLNSMLDKIDFPRSKEPDEVLRKCLTSLYKKARTMTPSESRNLVALLNYTDEDTVVRTLTTISNCAAFSINQDLLCDAGCLPILKDFLDSPTLAIQVAATQAIANLSANERNQGLLQSCIYRLSERATSPQCTELLRVSSLTALANLALFNANHMPMKSGITGFLQLIESGTNTTRLQSLKLLVNISCNNTMLPYLLVSRSSPQLYKYLSLKGDHDVTLRLITFLANVVITAARQNFKPRHLPGEQKAPYPETLYATIYGISGKDILRKRLATLVQSTDEDIVLQVKRIQAATNMK